MHTNEIQSRMWYVLLIYTYYNGIMEDKEQRKRHLLKTHQGTKSDHIILLRKTFQDLVLKVKL